MRGLLVVLALIVLPTGLAGAQESVRIKRKPPTSEEADRMAADMAMNDTLLRKGDIVATGHGFVVFQGVNADGINNDFAPVENPARPPVK